MSQSSDRVVLLSLALASFVALVAMSSLNVALPAISEDLGASAVQASWIVMAFAFIQATGMYPASWLAEKFGRKRIYLSGLILMGITLLLASVVNEVRYLIVLRMLQGASAALVFGTANAIIVSVFPPDKRGMVLGVTAGAVYLGLTLGPVLGGYVTAWFSWREVFLMPLPLLCVVIWLTADRLQLVSVNKPEGSFDWLGLMLFTGSIALALFGVSRIYEPSGWLALLLSATCFAGFVKTELEKENPLIDVGLFANNRTFGLSCLSTFLSYSSAFSIGFLLSLYLQYVTDLGPEVAGNVLMITAACMAVTSPITGRLSDIYPARWLASFGLVLHALGLFLLARLDGSQGLSQVVTAQMLIGFGFGFFSAPNSNSIMSSVSQRHVAQASASIPTMRGVGNLASMSIVTAVFAAYLGGALITEQNTPALLEGIQLCFGFTCVLAVLGAIVSAVRGDSGQTTNVA